MSRILALLSWKQMAAFAGVSALLLTLSFAGGYLYGGVEKAADARVECANEKTADIVEKENRFEKAKQKNFTQSDLAACRKWCGRVRDDQKLCLSRCKRGDLPVRP